MSGAKNQVHNGTLLQSQLQTMNEAGHESIGKGADTLASLWQPYQCPVPFLPWLAWSQGVNQWDEAWPEQVKRDVIAQSFEQHKHLGTRYAIINSVKPFGYKTELKEWFEMQPPAQAGTFSVDVGVTNKGIDFDVIEQIYTAISNSKRKSVQFDLSVSLLSESELQLAAATTTGVTTTVYPYFASEITSQSSLNIAIANQSINQIKIYPRSSYVTATILDHADPSGAR
ncbi:hypothetical protein PSECIP111854_02047 [Pseudoalteromonas sp. CIP111854]|uniref:Phage tail protein I n=1 Tax=Pseudoalteromonas holothuriae TaxID=2963714 RepID=A0A9W4VVB8_9GAMM|nr:phage tail protein I [Pseudoalteromonas sp. CIP111854]CAH9057685.1 hypothetical protein PSECIP111854_02047 [Pseudoalteromonas sp. CIP111854]